MDGSKLEVVTSACDGRFSPGFHNSSLIMAGDGVEMDGGEGGEKGNVVESPVTSEINLNMMSEESSKKRRGRPIKNDPVAITPVAKRKRGRPLGSKKKQRFQAVAGAAGTGLTVHIINVKAGEDVYNSISSFLENNPRPICILTANGEISKAVLRLAGSTTTTTFQGRYKITSLSGTSLLTGNGGDRSREGSLQLSLSQSDGQVIGGEVAGPIKAATQVQVTVGSFITGTDSIEKISMKTLTPPPKLLPLLLNGSGHKPSAVPGGVPNHNTRLGHEDDQQSLPCSIKERETNGS